MLRLTLPIVLAVTAFSASAQAPKNFMGMSAEAYRQSCGQIRFREIFGYNIADCFKRPQEYALFQGGTVRGLYNSFGLSNVVGDKACGPEQPEECMDGLRQALAQDAVEKAAEIDLINPPPPKATFGTALQAFAKGLASGSSEPATSTRRITGDAPFCVVQSYGTRCNYYILSVCQDTAASTGGACVVRP